MAVNYGCEVAMNYLMIQKANVNCQDYRGLTPLHLAVIASEELQSTRSIRALLLKGADTNIKDNDGKIPAEYLLEFKSNFPNTQMMIDDIDDLLEENNPSCIQRLNPLRDIECFEIKQKFKPGVKSNKTMLCFFFLQVFLFVILDLWIYVDIYSGNESKKHKRQWYKDGEYEIMKFEATWTQFKSSKMCIFI